jgi:hypothetical protein
MPEALESASHARLFCGVPQPSSSRVVVVVGGVVAAATTGALIAIGHRAGSVWLPFVQVGSVMLGRTSGGSMAALIAGVAVHVAAMFVWTLAFIWLADRLNRVLAAIMVGAANFVVSYFVARSTGAGLASALTLGDRVTFAVILMIALVVGMRYARPSLRNA